MRDACHADSRVSTVSAPLVHTRSNAADRQSDRLRRTGVGLRNSWCPSLLALLPSSMRPGRRTHTPGMDINTLIDTYDIRLWHTGADTPMLNVRKPGEDIKTTRRLLTPYKNMIVEELQRTRRAAAPQTKVGGAGAPVASRTRHDLRRPETRRPRSCVRPADASSSSAHARRRNHPRRGVRLA